MGFLRAWPLLLVPMIAWLTSCEADDQACAPGESAACTGPGQCSGFQVCKGDGSGYDACQCGDATTSSTTAAGSTTGAGGGGSTTGSSSTSSGVGGSGGGGAWSPSDLGGLSLWLHAGAGLVYDPQNPGVIIKWDDQSPNQHQAVLGGNQPGQGASLDPSALNGLDAVKCAGQGMEFRIDDDPSLQLGTGGYMIGAVVRTAPQSGFNSATHYYLKEGVGTSVGFGQPSQSILQYVHGNDALAVSVSTAGPEWYVVTLRGPAMELHVGDGMSSGPMSTANVDNPGQWVFVCKAESSTFEIAELFVVKGAVSDTDFSAARQYLTVKYGL